VALQHTSGELAIGVARGCTGCMCTPKVEKIFFWAKFTG